MNPLFIISLMGASVTAPYAVIDLDPNIPDYFPSTSVPYSSPFTECTQLSYSRQACIRAEYIISQNNQIIEQQDRIESKLDYIISHQEGCAWTNCTKNYEQWVNEQ